MEAAVPDALPAREDAHPHELRAAIPDRLPAAVVRRLSAIEPRRALAAVAREWAGVVVAIAICEATGRWWLYPLAVAFIGARQHALAIIAHDASHYRFLPNRRLNDVLGDLLTAWPVFITVAGFRKFHGEHHQHLGEAGDGNRALWRTHGPDGRLVREWTYPKTPLGLALTVLRRGAVFTGVRWMLRGTIGSFLFAGSPAVFVLRALTLVAGAAALTLTHAWTGFLLYWVVPYCTWQVAIQYLRLICEHSAIPSDDPAYGQTRTTRVGAWARLFVLPCNVSYHLEHHWYPSVPFYNLRDLHAALMEQPGFRERAVVTDSLMTSLRQVASA